MLTRLVVILALTVAFLAGSADGTGIWHPRGGQPVRTEPVEAPSEPGGPSLTIYDSGLRVYQLEDGTTVWDYSDYDATVASLGYERWAEAHPEEVRAAYEEWITPQICGLGLLNGRFPDPDERARFIATCRSVGIWITGPQQA